jgi:hypothetical protein
MKMEATGSSATLAPNNQVTRHCIPEGHDLNTHRLKSHICLVVLVIILGCVAFSILRCWLCGRGERLKSSIYWDIKPCSPFKVNQETRMKRVASSLHASCCLLAWLILLQWKWRQHVLPKRLWTFDRLHGLMSQKLEPFITTAVKTSHPAKKQRIFVFALLLSKKQYIL